MKRKQTNTNNYYKRAFNYMRGSILGQPYEMTMHPDDTKVCEEVAGKCFTHPDSTFPATIRKHDGKGGYLYNTMGV